MPVSLEQWRASVGANNSASSYMLKKYWGSRRAPKNPLDLLLVIPTVVFDLEMCQFTNVEGATQYTCICTRILILSIM